MKIPLKPKRTDFSFKSFIDEPQAVGKILRERLGGNWPGITPGDPPAALRVCSAHKDCTYSYDFVNQKSHGQCKGVCGTG